MKFLGWLLGGDYEYFEVLMPDGDATCSDNECPCGFPGARIPHGTGYLIITEDVVEFRRDALSIDAARNKVEKLRFRNIYFDSSGVGVVTPILCCEQSPKLKNIDRNVASDDARNCWKTGRAPLRATPPA